MARPRQTRATFNAPAAGAATPGAAGGIDSAAPGWPVWARAVVSLLIVVHLSAVVLAALTLVGGSDLWNLLAAPLRPYIEAADLNHGYRFFNEPGPSHLVRFHLTMPDGSRRDGVIPNLAKEKPRLLYHRYFMLSEHLASLYGMRLERGEMMTPDAPEFAHGPGGPSPSLETLRVSSRGIPELRRMDDMLQALVRSYAGELLRRYGATSVRLELAIHNLPSPRDVLRGRKLDDPALFETIDLGTFSAREEQQRQRQEPQQREKQPEREGEGTP